MYFSDQPWQAMNSCLHTHEDVFTDLYIYIYIYNIYIYVYVSSFFFLIYRCTYVYTYRHTFSDDLPRRAPKVGVTCQGGSELNGPITGLAGLRV